MSTGSGSAAGVAHEALVDILDQAERTRVAVAPLIQQQPGLGVREAYAIQAVWLARKLRAGDRLAGHKVGLTSKAMQEQLGVGEPDFGSLLASMLLDSGSTLARADLLQPRIEPEIAFWLREGLRGPGVTREQVLAATEAVSASLEVVDSRIADWKITLVDTVADNGSSARAVLAAKRVLVANLDLAAVSVRLFRNDEEVGTGTGAAVLGHPAEAVAWLANTLARFGQALEAGQVVLPGAMCASVFAHAGDTFRAEFSRLGAVSVRFA